MKSKRILSAWCMASAVLFMQACKKEQRSYLPPTNHTTARATTPGLAPGAAAGTIVSITHSAFTSNFAGDGTPGLVNSTGDFARFNNPGGMAIDAAGNVFVADRANNVIRKVTPFGEASTYAGSGSIGSADGSATQAQFFFPFSVAIDADGKLYVADTYNHRIREILQDRSVTTYAGSTPGLTDGHGTAAQFNFPFDVTSDKSHRPNLFVADYGNNLLREVTGNIDVQWYAGNNAGFSDGYFPFASFFHPRSVCEGILGNLYVADAGNNAIRRVRGDIHVETIGGAGPSQPGYQDGYYPQTRFSNPTGVAADSAGNVYIADHDNHVIRMIEANGWTHTLAGTGSAGYSNGIGTAAAFNHPYAVAVAGNGDLYVSEETGNRIRKLSISSFGKVGTFAGNGTPGLVNSNVNDAEFVSPAAVAVDAAGNTYVSDYGNDLIRKIDQYGQVTTFAGSTKGFKNGAGTAAQFSSPTGLAIDAQGNILVADANNHRIRKITPAGVVTTLAGQATRGFKDARDTLAQFDEPLGIAIDADGAVYVADAANNRIRKISTDGQVTTLAGSGKAGTTDGAGIAAQFNAPAALSVDNNGNVYVADRDNNRIRKITFGGQVSTLAGSIKGFANGVGTAAQFSQPYGIVVDAAGMVYVTDRGNNRIRKITPGGVVSTQAGSGNGTFYDGDGFFASFKLPFGIAMDGSGRLLIGDWDNHRIRIIQ